MDMIGGGESARGVGSSGGSVCSISGRCRCVGGVGGVPGVGVWVLSVLTYGQFN